MFRTSLAVALLSMIPALPGTAQSPQRFDQFALCSFAAPDRATSAQNYTNFVVSRSSDFRRRLNRLEKNQNLSQSQVNQMLAESEGVFQVNDTLEGISCSHALLDWNETKNVYGRAIADTYIAVEVTVRNLDPDHEFLLHQVELAAGSVQVQVSDDEALTLPGRPWVEARGKRVARGVLERGQDVTARNILIRFLEVVATTASSAALVGSEDFNNGTHIFSAFVPGFRDALPDLTIRQLNRFDDTAFESGTVLVPKRGAISFVTFINQKVFGHRLRTNDKGKLRRVKFKKFNGEELMQFQSELATVISGAHVQEVSSKPSLSAIDPVRFSRSVATPQKVHLSGTGFSNVRAIRFRTDRNGVTAESTQDSYIVPITPTTASAALATIEVLPSSDKIFPSAGGGADPIMYKVILVLVNGMTVETDATITIDK